MGICSSKKDTLSELALKSNINVCVTDKNYHQDIEKIKLIDPTKIPYFNWKGKIFYARPCNIYDGDTFSICWVWKGDIIKYRCRCLGYDSPEMKPRKVTQETPDKSLQVLNANRDKEKEMAKAAKERFEQLLNANSSGLIKVECDDFDKYGRILVIVWNGIETKSINQIMLDEGHGRPYLGGTKESWS